MGCFKTITVNHPFIPAVLLLVFLGCVPEQPVTVVPPPKVYSGDLVPHPEYVNWSQFPVGTQVVRKDALASENGDLFQLTTLRLAKKSEAAVVVESQTTIQRAGKDEIGEVLEMEYPAEFQIPDGMELDQFTAPSLTAELKGNETIDVAGKTFEADLFEFVDTAEAGPCAVTVWRSNDIPGKQAKKQIIGPDGNQLSSSETIEISIPE